SVPHLSTALTPTSHPLTTALPYHAPTPPRHASPTRRSPDLAPPPEDRLGVAVLPGLLDRGAQVVAHGPEPLEVAEHELFGLLLLDPELLGEAERAQAVHEAVRHRLDLAAHLPRDVLGGGAQQ